MTMRIHMGVDYNDAIIDVVSDENETHIIIGQENGDESIQFTPEGARSLAFMLIGATDVMIKDGRLKIEE